MEIIDNINTLLGDDLRRQVRPGSKLRIAASTFSIYAYEALKEELEQIEELEFVFTSPAFTPEQATDRLPKERREFFIPAVRESESALYGTDFEIRLRNQLTQRAIARECADWVRRKARFRSNRTGNPMQQFAIVDNAAVYQPLHGFTSADLGYERTAAVSNLVTKVDDASATATFWKTFTEIWNDPAHVEDVTSSVYDHIASVYAENSPARVYFLILYNVFAEFLEDVTADVLPNDLTGYQDTQIWQGLYNFQRDAATGAINKLETYNGCILADSVGLGKTFTALAVIKYYELRNKSVLVLAPKKLAENWTTYKGNLTTNLFVKDRFSYDVLAHTDLSRTSGESLGMPLDRINWGNYDLVVIDESHNFRNNDVLEDRETRYQRLLNAVIRDGVRTKVLMLSATPVNNHFIDLRNQLALAYEGESEQLSGKLQLRTSIEEVFRQAQRAFNEWSALPPDERTAEAIVARLDFDFFELLDAVTIARSRKHIQAFYDTSEIGAFPKRMKPEAVRPPLTDLPGAPSFNEIYEQLTALTMAVYAPLNYVFASRRAKYAELYDPSGEGGLENLGHAGREQGIQRLMTTNLLKRLESSVEAFRLTLGKLGDTIGVSLAAIHDGQRPPLGADDWQDFDPDDDELAGASGGTVGGKVKIDLADMDVERWQQDLEADKIIIDALHRAMRAITPEHDVKLQELRRRILAKVERPLNPGNRKVLVFSAFADTADYLYRELASTLAEAGLGAGLVTGRADPRTTVDRRYSFQQVLTLFSPRSKSKALVLPDDPAELDVLVATDCISEGQNLQDCDFLINYDIHWNPVRIIQRFGRIDRIGSTNERIQLVNFWPDISLDEYINLKERVENRMVIADLAATADDNVLAHAGSDTSFRRDQLRRLQDEVIELEDVKTGVSITDLGLNDFRMDLVAYVQQHGDLARSPKGLHAVVPARPEIGLVPGAIFALRNVHAGTSNNQHNRLHPHYLVYVDDAGQVIVDHTEVKQLLDLVRVSCRDEDEPLGHVCRVFNAATDEGAAMDHYSELLTDAIRSMIEVTEERDVESLFTPGPTTALTQAIAGLDDFELIAFLAVIDPEARRA